jgi:predicted nucleotidyltransferase
VSHGDELVARITEVLSGDPRVLAAWLVGSRGRGAEDRFSDVDVWLVVSDEDRSGFVEDWPALSDQVSPSVLRRRVVGSTFTHISPAWERWDVSIGVPGDVPRRARSTVTPLFDRADLGSRLQARGEPLRPDPVKVTALVTEFLRVLGLLPVVLGREEYVVGVSGVGLLRELVIQLLLEQVAVEDRGGALHLNTLLPPERVRQLERLPAAEASRESVLDAHLACARLFLPEARRLAASIGVEWPAPLEAALRRRLETELGVTID